MGSCDVGNELVFLKIERIPHAKRRFMDLRVGGLREFPVLVQMPLTE